LPRPPEVTRLVELYVLVVVVVVVVLRVNTVRCIAGSHLRSHYRGYCLIMNFEVNRKKQDKDEIFDSWTFNLVCLKMHLLCSMPRKTLILKYFESCREMNFPRCK